MSIEATQKIVDTHDYYVNIPRQGNSLLTYAEMRSRPLASYWENYTLSGVGVGGIVGRSRCCEGNGQTLFALPNCVGYAWGRAREVWDAAYRYLYPETAGSSYYNSIFDAKGYCWLTMDAGSWISYASRRGLPCEWQIVNGRVNPKCQPEVGCIISWPDPGDCGHVAFVEEVHENYYMISESGWYGGGKWLRILTQNRIITRDSNGAWGDGGWGYQYGGFIYPPAEIRSKIVQSKYSLSPATNVTISNRMWMI